MRINDLNTLRFSYLRFLAIEVAICVGYTIVNYFILQHIAVISDTTKTFLFPLVVALLSFIFYYRSRLKMMPKLNADEFRVWMLIMMLVVPPPIILQMIVADESIETIEVAVNEPIALGTGKMKIELEEKVSVDTSSVGTYYRTYTSYRKNGRDDRHYEAYIVAPVLTRTEGKGSLWFGKKIDHVDQRDDSSEEEIKKKMHDLRDTAGAFFRSMVCSGAIRSMEINTSNSEYRDFQRAVSSTRVWSPSEVVIATEIVQRKSINFKLRAFFITLGITQGIWLIFCLFIPVSYTSLREYLAMTAVDRNKLASSNFLEAFYWLTPKKGYVVTPLLILSNVLVYLVMGIMGVGFDAPDGNDMITWGSNYGPLVQHGQVWRLITAGFLHFGFIHIMFNMIALGLAGSVLERVIGSKNFAILFFVSVIGCSLSSNWVHHYTQNSAGASGGIFGVLAPMLIYALFGIGSQENRTIMILLFVFFAAPTIGIGLVGYSRVDNAGHFGGLIAGGIVSLFFIPEVRAAGDVFDEPEL